MNQYDSILKTYSDSGLRTIEDWSIRGRDIIRHGQSAGGRFTCRRLSVRSRPIRRPGS